MTILIHFHQSHYRNFKTYYTNYVLERLHGDFPGLVSYTRFVEYIPSVLMPLCVYLRRSCFGLCTGISFMDSTPLAMCKNPRIHSHRVFTGLAERGKTSTGWFFGFKLHLIFDDQGELLNVMLTPGNVNDRKPVPKMARQPKKLTEWARQVVLQTRRWVIVRDPKNRFKTQSVLCTDPTISAEQIVQWFPRRWQVEVTFHEARTHLGVETQRQWADLSILRITPALLSLFSIITLLANVDAQKHQLPVQKAAWYVKKLPTFSDAFRTVKQKLDSYLYFQTSPLPSEVRKPPPIRSHYRFSRFTRAFFQVSYG